MSTAVADIKMPTCQHRNACSTIRVRVATHNVQLPLALLLPRACLRHAIVTSRLHRCTLSTEPAPHPVITRRPPSHTRTSALQSPCNKPAGVWSWLPLPCVTQDHCPGDTACITYNQGRGASVTAVAVRHVLVTPRTSLVGGLLATVCLENTARCRHLLSFTDTTQFKADLISGAPPSTS